MSAANRTASVLASQWTNPSEVTTVLMIIGGDVVQKALAQTTGCWYSPVCFSFGWVPYSFTALVNILGDGRLLPEPDVGCKVINLDNGYARDNKNWVIGRLLRDSEARAQRLKPPGNEAIRISIWEAVKNPNKLAQHRYWSIHIWGLVFMTLQIGLSIIPLILYKDWGILMITGAGNFLSIIMGALPQWTAEKLPNRQISNSVYALTVGNGSRDVMVIKGDGNCLDLEELSVSETPRSGRPWKKFKSSESLEVHETWSKPGLLRRRTSDLMATKLRGGFPVGFLVTYAACIVLSILWLALLVSVSALESHTWFLLGVGFIGMFQNAVLAAAEIKAEHRNLPLRYIETIVGKKKVMDGIMDFHIHYQCGQHLLREFFPGALQPQEEAWWKEERDPYDDEREKHMDTRGPPQQRMLDSQSESPAEKYRDVDESAIETAKSSIELQNGQYRSATTVRYNQPKAARAPEIAQAILADHHSSKPHVRTGKPSVHSILNNATLRPTLPRSPLRSYTVPAAASEPSITPTLPDRPLSMPPLRPISPVSKLSIKDQDLNTFDTMVHKGVSNNVPRETSEVHHDRALEPEELPEAADWT